MKITQPHYNAIRDAALQIKNENPAITPESYVTNKIGKDHALRFRFDLLHSAVKRNGSNFVSELYNYLNDDHLDTAMKKIVKELY